MVNSDFLPCFEFEIRSLTNFSSSVNESGAQMEGRRVFFHSYSKVQIITYCQNLGKNQEIYRNESIIIREALLFEPVQP